MNSVMWRKDMMICTAPTLIFTGSYRCFAWIWYWRNSKVTELEMIPQSEVGCQARLREKLWKTDSQMTRATAYKKIYSAAWQRMDLKLQRPGKQKWRIVSGFCYICEGAEGMRLCPVVPASQPHAQTRQSFDVGLYYLSEQTMRQELMMLCVARLLYSFEVVASWLRLIKFDKIWPVYWSFEEVTRVILNF